MRAESEALQELSRMESENTEKICELVRESELNVQDHLMKIVAKLCGISTDDLMNKTYDITCSHARWLFWYAHRYMTGDTYERISRITELHGRMYGASGIIKSVNKMSMLIDTGTIWTNRWYLLKQIINARKASFEFDFGQQQIPSDKIFISIPKEFKNKVEIKYTD